MLKKNKKDGLYSVFTVYHKPSQRFRGLFYHTTDEECIRITLPDILMDYALRDITLYCIGLFDDINGVFSPYAKKKAVDLSKYLFPHSTLSPEGEDLPLEEIDTKMKEFKAQKIVELYEKKVDKKSGKKG